MIIGLSVVLSLSSCQKGSSQNGSSNSSSDKNKVLVQNGPKRGDLTLAAATGQTLRVQELLRQGADPNESVLSNGNRMTPLMAAILHPRAEIVRALMSRGATDTGEYLGYTGRDFALYKNQDEIVNLLDGARK
jgi:ankyrin repeat protein